MTTKPETGPLRDAAEKWLLEQVAELYPTSDTARMIAKALAPALARKIEEARLEEAKWWACQRECVYTLGKCQHDQRIAELEKDLEAS